jgi:hypothetical protein
MMAGGILAATQQEGTNMKSALAILGLFLAFTIATRADCNPATCPYGSHSKCVEQCDPNYLNCTVKICKCHCEKDPEPKAVVKSSR